MTSKDIYNSVCRVITKRKLDIEAGTMFFFEDKNKNKYIVSNKHVFCGNNNEETILYLYLNLIDNITKSTIKRDIEIPLQKNFILKSEFEDIAIYPIDDVIKFVSKENLSLDYYFIKEEDVFINYKSLDYIENILCVGYPSCMMEYKGHNPITTGGITATPIFYDFEDNNCFLADVTAYGGSSGSPVFIKLENTYKLIGIIYGTINKTIMIQNIFNTENQNIHNITGKTESLISCCVKSDSIMKLLLKQSD